MAEVATPLDSINKEEAPAVEVAAKEAEAVDAVDAAPVCHLFFKFFYNFHNLKM